MKKKFLATVAMLLAFATIMTGCGSATTDNKEKDTDKDKNKVEQNDDADTNADADEDADADADTNADADADADANEGVTITADVQITDMQPRPNDSAWVATTNPTDDLAYENGWTVYYMPLSGGIYMDDVQISIPIMKLKPNQYLLYFQRQGITPVEGVELKVDCVIGTGDYSVHLGPATYIYDGASWIKQ